MRALICYFSGTGNTKRVVNKYAESLTTLGVKVDVHNIEDEFIYDINQYDLIGLGYPIHAFNAPSNVLKFVKTLPKAKLQKKAFIVKTSGEPLALNNISSIKIEKMFKKRNMILTNEYHYVMPYNIIFRHSDAMAFKMWQTAQDVIPVDCKEIVNGMPSRLGRVLFGGVLAWLFRIEHWGGRFNGKRYKVKDSCVKCQMCVKICPTHNITFENGVFHFGNKCLMCMRCAHLCNKDAIKIGLFERWKVNGVYSFKEPNSQEQEKHKKYCKKSYEKYFLRCENKVKSSKTI